MRATKTNPLPTITRYLKDSNKALFTLIEGYNKYLSTCFRIEGKVKQYLQCKYIIAKENGAVITGLRPTGITNIYQGDILGETKTGKWKNSFLLFIVSKSNSQTGITILFYLNNKPRNPQKFLRNEVREYFSIIKNS